MSWVMHLLSLSMSVIVRVKYALVPTTRTHTGEGRSEEEKAQEWMDWGWGQTFHTDWPLSSKPSREHEGDVGERLCPKIHGPVFLQIRHWSFQLITWVLQSRCVDMSESLLKYLSYLCVSLSACELLEELLCILSSRNLLTRAALHLLLLPQLSCLSLASACSLVNANLCSLIQIRCQVKHTLTPLLTLVYFIFAQSLLRHTDVLVRLRWT